MELWPQILAFLQVVLIDVSMAGDNAIAVGMAAAGLPKARRNKAVMGGILIATVLRIIFAIFAVQILRITGLLVAGGLLLLWVTWKMYLDIRDSRRMKHPVEGQHGTPKTLMGVITQIAVADVSMSLDNVLAVAGVAREHLVVLAFGLTLSVVLMGVAATFIAKLTTRWPWIAYIGLVIVFITALHMMWDGAQEFLQPV